MREKWFTVTVVLLACLGMLLFLFTFNVREDQLVVHRRFGKDVSHTRTVVSDTGVQQAADAKSGEVTVYDGRIAGETGFYFKFPPPIDRIYKYDQRIRTMRPTQIQRLLADKATVIADVYATWRISDPQKLLRNAYGDEETAATRLSTAINTAAGEVLGKKMLSDLVNTDPSKVQLDSIEADIMKRVMERDVAQDNGLEIISLGIASIRFPLSTTKAVFERMQAERKTREEELISEGQREAQKLRAEAQKNAAELNNSAARTAKQLYADAQLAALDAYKTLTAAPELATYLRRLDAFRSIAASAMANEQPLLFVLTSDAGVFSILGNKDAEDGMDIPDPPEAIGTLEAGGEE